MKRPHTHNSRTKREHKWQTTSSGHNRTTYPSGCRVTISSIGGENSVRARSARHDPLVQFLIHDLDRAVDLGIGHAELMRDQFHQQVDALDEGRAASHG